MNHKIVIMIFCLLCLSCNRGEPSNKGKITDGKATFNVKPIESQLGVTFPESTKWLGYYVITGLDDRVCIKFSAPKDQVIAMLNQVHGHQTDSIRIINNIEHLEWYRPDSITNFMSVNAGGNKKSGSNKKGFFVLFDNGVSSSSMTTVYIEYND